MLNKLPLQGVYLQRQMPLHRVVPLRGPVRRGSILVLVSVGVDCVMYATTHVISKTAMAADVVSTTVMCAIVGAVVGMVMGMGKKAS